MATTENLWWATKLTQDGELRITREGVLERVQRREPDATPEQVTTALGQFESDGDIKASEDGSGWQLTEQGFARD